MKDLARVALKKMKARQICAVFMPIRSVEIINCHLKPALYCTSAAVNRRGGVSPEFDPASKRPSQPSNVCGN